MRILEKVLDKPGEAVVEDNHGINTQIKLANLNLVQGKSIRKDDCACVERHYALDQNFERSFTMASTQQSKKINTRRRSINTERLKITEKGSQSPHDQRTEVDAELTAILGEMTTQDLICLRNALDIFNTTTLFLAMGKVSYGKG